MTTGKELEERAAQCDSVDEFLTLADEASQDPTDHDFAKQMLQQAEIKWQLPGDYSLRPRCNWATPTTPPRKISTRQR
ncbi:MAG: hypothetical protein OET44_12885 [Gammaproteobacteria bacterium]|nr:hypothetical protein [Gammaproteobacteria bacterium]